MRDYAELVKALRHCADYDCTPECPRAEIGEGCIRMMKHDAANAIEELSRNLKDCRNELCLRCGDYHQRHMGACSGCRWLDEPSKEESK